MRLIFHNPHNKVFFGQTLIDFIIRNNLSKKSQKYKYILDFFWEKKIKFWIYLDYKWSSLPVFLQRPIFIKIEVFFWLLLKKINPVNVKIMDHVDQMKKDDIFFSFSLTTLDTDYHGIDTIVNKNIIKLFHFTHYVQNTSLIAKNFERLEWDFIIAENNLKNSTYFNHFFKRYNRNVYTLPFTYGKRYKNKIEFKERQNKCLSVGAVINTDDYKNLFSDFSSFYSSDTLQPLRKQILNKIDKYSKYIDTVNSSFKPQILSTFQKIKKIIFGFKYDYFKFDMVAKFNQYKMFMCWEELWDMPWIWFVEWMACWCAYLWKHDSMYTDLWLIPWVHYISHNGSLEDILEKVKYYQTHSDELDQIATAWSLFVQEHFSWPIVAQKFYDDLIALNKNLTLNHYHKDKFIFNSSFIDKWNQ